MGCWLRWHRGFGDPLHGAWRGGGLKITSQSNFVKNEASGGSRGGCEQCGFIQVCVLVCSVVGAVQRAVVSGGCEMNVVPGVCFDVFSGGCGPTSSGFIRRLRNE